MTVCHCAAFCANTEKQDMSKHSILFRHFIQTKFLRCVPYLMPCDCIILYFSVFDLWLYIFVSLNRAEKTEVLSDDLLQVNMTFFSITVPMCTSTVKGLQTQTVSCVAVLTGLNGPQLPGV